MVKAGGGSGLRTPSSLNHSQPNGGTSPIREAVRQRLENPQFAPPDISRSYPLQRARVESWTHSGPV
jgi:hypothetical protein